MESIDSFPEELATLKLLGDDYEKSIDPEDVREDLKTELLALHMALKKLDNDLDFSAVILPLIAEQGPAAAHVLRLSKQINRLKKFRADFLRDKQESLKIRNDFQRITLETTPAAPSGLYVGSAELCSHEIPEKAKAERQKRRAQQYPPEFTPTEVLPSWGILKRYSAAMDLFTYNNAVATADWMYRRMLSHPGGPAECYPAALLFDPPQHLLVKRTRVICISETSRKRR
jgi:hypothetical protein